MNAAAQAALRLHNLEGTTPTKAAVLLSSTAEPETRTYNPPPHKRVFISFSFLIDFKKFSVVCFFCFFSACLLAYSFSFAEASYALHSSTCVRITLQHGVLSLQDDPSMQLL